MTTCAASPSGHDYRLATEACAVCGDDNTGWICRTELDDEEDSE